MAIIDYGSVLQTPVAPIAFNNFFLPPTFRVVSKRAGRRLTSTPIEGRAGVLQQTTFDGPQEIQIEGIIYPGLMKRNSIPLSERESIDEILRYITTQDDRPLYIDEGRYYNARLRNNDITYEVDTNRKILTMTLAFVISDPYQYEHEIQETPVQVTPVARNIGNAPQIIETLRNRGNTETPVYIALGITNQIANTSESNNTIQIKVYSGIGTIIAGNLYLKPRPDEPYTVNSDIIIDSQNIEIVYRTGTESKLIFHHIQNEAPIQNVPIQLPIGNTNIGFRTEGSGTFTATIQHRNRWR